VAFVAAHLAVFASCGGESASARRSPGAGDAGIRAAGGLRSEGGACPECAGDGSGAASEAGGAQSRGGGGADGGAGDGADAVALRDITVSQTVELPLMRSGSAVSSRNRPSPLIARKQALVRVFIDAPADVDSRLLIGVLDLKSSKDADTVVSELVVRGDSEHDALSSGFAFPIEARDLAPDTTYRVRILEANKNPIAAFPDEGYLPLEAEAVDPFELVLVPLVASGHAPQTREEDLEALRQRLLALYPISDLEVSVAKPVTLSYPVSAADEGWDRALDDLYDIRAAANPAPTTFYYGMLAPDASYSAYCKSGCTLGYSVIAGPRDEYYRGSIGVTIFEDGSGGSEAWNTLAHELGHALGRAHAPCGIEEPSEIDPEYPYPHAGIGANYGYDFVRMHLIKPKRFRDVMSYCAPVWISDYTYSGIFGRLSYLQQSSFGFIEAEREVRYRVARIDHNRQSRWQATRSAPVRPGELTKLPVLNASHQPVGDVEAGFVRVSQGPGGYVWVAEHSVSQAAAIDLRPLGGSRLSL